MIGGALARRYARALLDIGKDEGQARRIFGEVEAFHTLVSANPMLREAMEAAHINRRDKHAALDGVLLPAAVLPSTGNFLRLLVDKGRMNILPQILVELRRLVEEMEGIERIEIVVPMALSAGQKDTLRTALAKQTGKTIELEETVDPAVLGGMVVKVGSTVYDGSIRTQIEQLKENLQKG